MHERFVEPQRWHAAKTIASPFSAADWDGLVRSLLGSALD
jgi:hypothetical protein